MKSIRLYPSNASVKDLLKGNGLGYLEEVTEAIESEEMNGDNTLDLKVPYLSPTYKKLKTRDILLAPVDDQGSWYPFRIYEIAKPINGIVEIKANGLDKDTSDYPVKPFTVVASDEDVGITVQDYLAAIYEASIITMNDDIWSPTIMPFWIDVDESYLDFDPLSVSTYEVTAPHSLRELLGDNEDYGVLGLFGGEYEYVLDTEKNKIKIVLHNRRGELTNIKFRYSKDIVGVEMEENVENQYNVVYPYWLKNADGGITLIESYHEYPASSGKLSNLVYCSDLYPETYATPVDYYKIMPLDITKYFKDPPTGAEIYETCLKLITVYNLDKPELTLKVTPALLQNSQQYVKEFGQRHYNLGDTVGLSYPEMGIDVLSMRVVKKELDCITRLYKSLEFENPVFYITDMVAEIATEAARTSEALYEEYRKSLPTFIAPFIFDDRSSSETRNVEYLRDILTDERFTCSWLYPLPLSIIENAVSAELVAPNPDNALFTGDHPQLDLNAYIYRDDANKKYGVEIYSNDPGPVTGGTIKYEFSKLIIWKG